MVYGLVIAVSSGVLMLALSSLSRNSRYVGLFWLGLWIISGMTSTILQGVDQSQRMHEQYASRNANAAQNAAPIRPGPPGARQAPAFARSSADDFAVKQLEASKSDWRPTVSYTQNLSRVGRQLLGTNVAWDKLSELQPPGIREQFLLLHKGQQFPWYWSAGVLAGLFGLSVCILNFRIKSLDRLK
jgi:ABC-2 type transport system permease protein